MSKTGWVKKTLTKSEISQIGDILKWVDKIQNLSIFYMTLFTKLWRLLLTLNEILQNSHRHGKHLTAASISVIYRCRDAQHFLKKKEIITISKWIILTFLPNSQETYLLECYVSNQDTSRPINMFSIILQEKRSNHNI